MVKFPVPAETPWRDGVPVLNEMDPGRTLALALGRRCAVCGCPIAVRSLLWRVRTSYERDMAAEHEGRIVEHTFGGHFSCMLYSAMACPFWSRASARYGKDNVLLPGAMRGERPALLGHRRAAVFTGPEGLASGKISGPDDEPVPAYLYADLAMSFEFETPEELAPLWARTAAFDGPILTRQRLFWGPEKGSPTALRRDTGRLMAMADTHLTSHPMYQGPVSMTVL